MKRIIKTKIVNNNNKTIKIIKNKKNPNLFMNIHINNFMIIACLKKIQVMQMQNFIQVFNN